jgi:hypothetical protein
VIRFALVGPILDRSAIIGEFDARCDTTRSGVLLSKIPGNGRRAFLFRSGAAHIPVRRFVLPFRAGVHCEA